MEKRGLGVIYYFYAHSWCRYALLALTIVKAPSEEDRDEAIRDLIEIVLKKVRTAVNYSVLQHCTPNAHHAYHEPLLRARAHSSIARQRV